MFHDPDSNWRQPVAQLSFLLPTGFASCDGLIGPFAYFCRRGRFDFTLLFEQYFLALLPSIVFILVALIRLTQLCGAKPKTVPSSIIYLKLVSALSKISPPVIPRADVCGVKREHAILAALQILVLIKWIQLGKAAPATGVSIGEPAVSLAVTLTLALLTHQEQRRSIIPSTIITVYLVISILFDGFRCRTLWLIGNANSVGANFTAALVVKFAILCLENQSKRSILIEDWKTLGREATSGLLSRSVLFWANDFLLQGYKSFLSIKDIYGLRRNLHSQLLLDRMSKHWRSHRGSGKRALLWNLLVSCRASILIGAIPRIGQSACKIAEPFLVNRVITYVLQQGTPGANPEDAGYALITAVFLVCIMRRITDSFYDQCKLRMKVAMRGSLISTVLHHATLLEPGAKEGSATLTLITMDVNRIMGAVDSLHEYWIVPIEVCVAAWLLVRQVGVGAAGPAIALIISTIFSSCLSRFMGPAQKQWAESVQGRIGDTTTILGSMKETKMLGLVGPWTTKLGDLMENQIAKSRMYRGLFVLLRLAGSIPDELAPAVTFGIAIWVGNGNLDLATAFTSLTIMQLVLGPLAWLVSSLPFVFTAMASAERLQEFVEISEGNQSLKAGVSNLSDTDELLGMAIFPGKPILAAKGATVKVKSKDEPILSDVTFTIQPGSFTVIAGKVGSGKSALIRALLGQLPSSGAILRQVSNVAYCAQSTWLSNATAKDNIIGQSEWDENWYNTVVRACALDQDFRELPDGDSALVGSKGLSLSGGQKQRISLARAIYSRKRLVIVDDLLSGLDWETQRHVWKQVFSEQGILRQNNTTLVLATHALHLIGTPDSVILLGDEVPGHVVQGTLDELKTKTKIQQLISSSQQESNEHKGDAKSSSGGPATKSPSAKKEDEEKRDLLRKTGDFSLYKFYFNAVGWSHVLHCLVSLLLYAAFMVLPDIWLKIWTEANSAPETVNTAFYYVIYLLLGVGSLAATVYVISLVLLDIGPTGIRNIHKRLLATVMRAPLSFFVATDTGSLINRFTRDVMQVDLDLPLNFFQLAIATFSFISSTALVVSGSYFMGVIILPMIIFVYYLQKFYLRTSRQLRFLDLDATAPLYNHFIETIDGAATIQAFGWESAFSTKGLMLLDEAQKPYYTLSIIQIWLRVVLGVFVVLVTVLLITFCVAAPSSTSGGAIALAFTHVLSLGRMLTALVISWTAIETSLGSIERLRSFETQTPREEDPEHPQPVEAAWPSEGRLELNSITASYNKSDGTSLQALDKVNISVQAGQKIGICGRTGSGKSSLLLTLFRLLDLDSGSIVLDGVDIAKVPHDLLRTRLIAVPQEPMTFPGTLRANLSPTNNEVPPKELDEQLIDCLRKVELWESISTQGGLDSTVADLGLSQGQKQLVCLARALARKNKTKVLVLDEAMSAVDQQTEALMVKLLEEEFASHTIISVVHRLNTIRKYDTVVLLDRGVVAEVGSPNELLEKKGGRFRELWNGKE